MHYQILGLDPQQDTSAEVSCIDHLFLEKHFPNLIIHKLRDMMNLVMADGQSLPFVGFAELSVDTGGICLEKVGFLVIRKWCNPGVILGTNLFHHMTNLYNESDLE